VSDGYLLPGLETDTGVSDNNGTGSAGDSHPLTASSSQDVSNFLSGISKWGSSIGQFFAKGTAPAQPRYGALPANANPNRSLTTGITSKNAVLVVGLVIVVGAVIALGGKQNV